MSRDRRARARTSARRERTSVCAVVLAMACAGAPGCGESGAMDAPDAAARPDRSVGGGADALWATEVVDEGDDVGLHVRLAVDEGGASHVAYFATEGEVVGPCDLGVEDDVPEEVRWTLRYATEAGSGWAREEVARVLTGLRTQRGSRVLLDSPTRQARVEAKSTRTAFVFFTCRRQGLWYKCTGTSVTGRAANWLLGKRF